MTTTSEQLQIFKCSVCGNIVEVLHVGGGELVCCEKPMQLLSENTEDAATEKHVPVIEETDDGITVKIGEVAHPMTDEHHIEWIHAIDAEGQSHRAFLAAGDAPEATFPIKAQGVKAREYCNLHGLWATE